MRETHQSAPAATEGQRVFQSSRLRSCSWRCFVRQISADIVSGRRVYAQTLPEIKYWGCGRLSGPPRPGRLLRGTAPRTRSCRSPKSRARALSVYPLGPNARSEGSIPTYWKNGALEYSPPMPALPSRATVSPWGLIASRSPHHPAAHGGTCRANRCCLAGPSREPLNGGPARPRLSLGQIGRGRCAAPRRQRNGPSSGVG
jgi:hypothetical protein